MTKHINNPAPQTLPIESMEVGYTKSLLRYGMSVDNDIDSVVFWTRNVTDDGEEQKTLRQYDINSRNFLLESLESAKTYSLSGAFLDSFAMSNQALVDSKDSEILSIYNVPNYTTKTPAFIESLEVNGSDLGQIGSPTNSLILDMQGEGTDVLIEYLPITGLVGDEQSSYDWTNAYTLYKGDVSPGDSISLSTPAYPFVIRVTSVYTFVNGTRDVANSTYYGNVTNPIVPPTSTAAPSDPTGLAATAIKVTGNVETYNLKLDWNWEAAENTGARRNALVSYRVLGTDTWFEETALDNTYTFVGVPYRKSLEARVVIKGWNLNESSTITKLVFISSDTADVNVTGYIAPVADTSIPVNTTVQINPEGIKAFKNWDGSTGDVTFSISAETGSVVIGNTTQYGGVAPFTFDGNTNILSIKGQTITDSIVAADYVMGWLDGRAPTFRTANRTALGGYSEDTAGIWMGYSDANTFKISMGDGVSNITWDGDVLRISSGVVIGDSGGRTIDQIQKYVQVYKRSASQPVTPTDGTYLSPIPTGWSKTIPEYDGTKCWTTTRTLTSDGEEPQDDWDVPSVISEAIDSAKLVNLTADSSVFVVDSEGVFDRDNVTITANVQNIDNPQIQWESVGGGGNSAGNTFTILKSDFGIGNSITVTATIPIVGGYISDSITVIKVQDGYDGSSTMLGYLTNEAHTIAANADGSISSYAGASGNMVVYYGETELTGGTYSLGTVTAGLTINLSPTTGAYSVTSLTVDSAVAEIIFTDPTYGTVSKVFSVSKSVKGTDGTDGIDGIDGIDGSDGDRGAGTFSTGYSGTWSGWNNTLAAAAAAATTGGVPVIDDVVTVYNANDRSIDPHIRMYTGGSKNLASSWDAFALVIHGNVLAEGSLRGDRLIAGTEITAPLIKGGRLEVGNAASGYSVIIDSADATSPIRVWGDLNPDGSRKLMLGWTNSNEFYFDGTLPGGKIDDMGIFAPHIRDIIAPKVQGALGGTFESPQVISGTGAGTTITTTTSAMPANDKDVDVVVNLSGGFIHTQDNPQVDKRRVRLYRSKNGGSWVEIASLLHQADFNYEPGFGYDSMFGNHQLAHTDTTHGAVAGDTLSYRAIATKEGTSYSLLYRIDEVVATQEVTGGGTEGQASSATFPYLGLDTSGSSSYPRIVNMNNPASSAGYIRVNDNSGGILPYSNGNSYIGTSSWKFKEIHSVGFFENGVALSSKYVQGNHTHNYLTDKARNVGAFGSGGGTPRSFFSEGLSVSFVDGGRGWPITYGKVLNIPGYTASEDGSAMQLLSPYMASYTSNGNPMFRIGKYNNQGWTEWRTIMDKAWADTLYLGVGGTAANSNKAGGLAVNSTTTNNQANKLVRTNGSGYIYAGWINTTSGGATTSIDRIYCSQDSFLRYLSPANFATAMSSHLARASHTHGGWDIRTLGYRITVDSTGRLSLNNGNYRSAGMYGAYDSTKTGHIWSMGIAYKIPDSGSNFGNLYGLGYKHTNNATGGSMAGGHQMVWCQNGTPYAAMGNGIWTRGTIVGADVVATSDRRVKSNIKVIGNALAKVCSITGNTYTRTDLSDEASAGIIAQEVEAVLPECVKENDKGIKQVSYSGVTALLVESVKELKMENDRLEARLAQIEKLLLK